MEEKEVEEEKVEKKEELQVDANTYFSLQLLMYDTKIAEAEILVKQLKFEKTKFIYDQQIETARKIDRENKLKQKLKDMEIKVE